MGTSIIGIPTTRVSDQFIRSRLLNQVQYDQAELFRLQTQLSTGRKFEAPSEDPVASLRAMSLQRLLERKEQVKSNIDTSGSYLSNTDVSLSETSNILADIRGEALTVIGTVANQEQREAVIQQVDEALKQLVDTGNQKFRGRYLFTGTRTSVEPFTWTKEGKVQYEGNEGHLESYGDIDLLFQTNFTGAEVFGAVSEPVHGTIDLDPVLTLDTRLDDIRHGRGLSKGSILISDGTNSSKIDLSSAHTVGDVLELIKNNPPPGREVYVGITKDVNNIKDAITIELDSQPGTNLAILEVGGGTVANELGILNETGVGNAQITGRDLDPTLDKTTALADCFGVRAWALLRSDSDDSNIMIEADTRGTQTAAGADLNGVTFSLIDDPLVIAGNEIVNYDPVGNTVDIYIDQNYTTADDVIAAINATADLPFTAKIDPLDDLNGGDGVVDSGISATTAEGSGAEFDKSNGLRVVNKDGTFDIAFPTAVTVEDMLNTINGFHAGVLAEINEDSRGIDLRSRVSGVDFMIGENGGTTATQLGLRSNTTSTRLEDLNFGRGVDTADGPDFTIRLARGGASIEADISGLETIGEVIDYLNTLDPELEARLAEYGNGIELVDTSTGPFPLSVERTITSHAAIDLGFIPEGYVTAGNNGLGTPMATSTTDPPTTSGGSPTTYAEGLVESFGQNNDLLFISKNLGAADNGVTINLVDVEGIATPTVSSYTPGSEITIQIDQGVHTANDVIDAVAADPLGLDWSVQLYAPNQADALPPTYEGQPEVNVVSPTNAYSNLIFQAVDDGGQYNGTRIIFDDTMAPGPTPTWDPVGKTLTFGVNGGQTAAQIKTALEAHPIASTLFTATFDPDDTENDGSGNVTDNVADPPVTANGSPTALSTATVTSTGFDNDMIFTANGMGVDYNGTRIELVENVGPGVPVISSYNRGVNLTIQYFTGGPHAATDIQALVNGTNPDWTVTFDPDDATPNTAGGGTVDGNQPAGFTMTGGTQVLTAADTNQQETESVFTALLRLKHGLESNDNYEAQRSIEILDRTVIDMNFSRAELGANEQSLELLDIRLEDEEVELKTILSDEIDADMVEVISGLTARQAAFEASLRSMGSIFQMSLLNYL